MSHHAAPARGAACPWCGSPSHSAYPGLAFIARAPYWRCRGCGLVWATPDPRSERRFYADDYPWLPHKPHEAQARTPLFEAFLDQLAAEGLAPGRLLDVGCGSGHFLAAASRRGWTVEGLEVAEPVARLAREQCRAPVHAGEIDDLARNQPATFDLVSFWNVLDQVPDPLATARAALRLLKPGGRLFARVPNGNLHRPLMALVAALGPGTRRLGIASLTPLHPWLLRPRDLVRLLVLAGFPHPRVGLTRLSQGHPYGTGAAARIVAALKQVTAQAARLGAATTGGRLLLGPSIEAHAWKEPLA